MKKHNFSAGPAILPASVIEQAAKSVADFNDMGLSILELSHRGPALTAVFEETEALTREIMGLSDAYHVLFLTGGASTQFFMTAMNLLDEDETAAYVDTGVWANKAIQEAKLFGNVNVLASSKAETYNHIPKNYVVPSDVKYLHLTSNNTIYGSQYHWWPESPVPVVCDMSSDFLSRPIDVDYFSLIYAGAQKNLGPAGVTMVIIHDDMLGKVKRKLPTMLDYRTHVKEKSLFNTPPVFPIYVSMLTMRWIKEMGGLKAMDEYNRKKGAILYDEMDRNPLFKGTIAKEDRSLMNICFVMENPELEDEFMKITKVNGIMDIKGHRSVGGFRASTYNAMPLESVQLLADLMSDFADKKG